MFPHPNTTVATETVWKYEILTDIHSHAECERRSELCAMCVYVVCVASPRLGLVSLSLCVIRQFIAALSVWQIVCNIAFCPFPNKLYVPRISIHGDGVRGPFICPKKKTCLDIRCHTHSECHFSSFSPFWTRKSIKMDKSGFNDL